ncbi:MAG: hypothetical protein DI565_11030 [Ancylobacter novellus]|uniref:Uncharacterized protein n=1 Tax=Ancylobacter novellus TaxID=921 RepID=A0A2W5KHM3_ANCNO|nr:MAG: hypothetical protein DI565_11030 [Ancylobacter novellus]
MTVVKGASTALLVCGVVAAAPSAVRAADVVSPQALLDPASFDVSFGVAVLSDYRFRGVTQSKRKPAVQGYVELQAFDWIYAGVWSSSVSFPTRFGLTDPAAEVDFYAGVRPTWGSFSLDAGYLYYWYPGESRSFPGQKQTDYWELKATPSIALSENGSISGNVWWSPNYANTGSSELYLSMASKIDIPVPSFPDLGLYVSGEFGKQWTKKADDGFDPKDFLSWNLGGGVTYKAMTIDIRYSDTNLSKSECVGVSGARTWCGSAVVGKIAFDTALSKLR